MISDEMIYLQKDLEEKIETIIGKISKKRSETIELFNCWWWDYILFTIIDNNNLSDEDINEISEIIKGDYISTESINQEYLIKFKYGLWRVLITLPLLFLNECIRQSQ